MPSLEAGLDHVWHERPPKVLEALRIWPSPSNIRANLPLPGQTTSLVELVDTKTQEYINRRHASSSIGKPAAAVSWPHFIRETDKPRNRESIYIIIRKRIRLVWLFSITLTVFGFLLLWPLNKFIQWGATRKTIDVVKSFILFSSWYSGGERKRSASNLQSKSIRQKKNMQKQKMLASSLVNKKQQVEHKYININIFQEPCTTIRSQSCWLRWGHQPILQCVECSWDCIEPTCRMVQCEDRLHWSPVEHTECSITIPEGCSSTHQCKRSLSWSLHYHLPTSALWVPCGMSANDSFESDPCEIFTRCLSLNCILLVNPLKKFGELLLTSLPANALLKPWMQVIPAPY